MRSAVLVSVVVATSLLGCRKPSHPPATARAPEATLSLAGVKCGSDRWDVKTGSDPDISAVNMQPHSTTVHAFIQHQRPAQWHTNLVRQVNLEAGPGEPAVEATLWKLKDIKLMEWRREGDHDIHLVVMDANGSPDEVLDVEFPDPACKGAIASPLKQKMQQARSDLIAACGQPPSGYKKITGTATIEGIGFFDKTNHGPSGIELHPALSFSGNCE